MERMLLTAVEYFPKRSVENVPLSALGPSVGRRVEFQPWSEHQPEHQNAVQGILRARVRDSGHQLGRLRPRSPLCAYPSNGGGAVIEWERRVILKHYLDQGLSHTAIARKLGVNRRTIYRLVRSGQLERDLEAEQARYRPRPPVRKKLDAYTPIIAARLEAYPELSCIRLFQEVRAAGYTGGLTQLKLFVRQVRPKAPVEAIIRFETPPAKQGQVDFGRFVLPWGIRYGLLVVLGYSRLLWLRFFRRQDMRTLMLGLEEAFH